MRAALLAKLEHLVRPALVRLPPAFAISLYSRGRQYAVAQMSRECPKFSYTPPDHLSRILWGIRFRSPLMNAAGMFKNGECYPLMAQQGAAGYLGGTGTHNARTGNNKHGIALPFVPYPKSHAASNFLGLPNDGDAANAERAASMRRINGCPVGWSVMGSPNYSGEDKLRLLVESLWLYARAGVDFLEINESCPNTAHGKPQDDNLAHRLQMIKQQFLDQRERRLPVIVKFSNDTDPDQVPPLLDLLFALEFDGVNFGNTSTTYAHRRESIVPGERKLYDYFTAAENFGGGVSGAPLRESSLELCTLAVQHIRAHPPKQEFHVIRTGGISNWNDLEDSNRAGVSLNQWYTGYFERFAWDGHAVYQKLFARK